MANTILLFSLCALLAVAWQAEATLSFARKPILNYLIRYKLGQLREAKLHGLHKVSPHGYGEEHYHHYYIEPFPHGATPLHPPTVIEAGHVGHAHFSLHSPHLGTELTYHNYWDLPPHHNHLF